MADIEITDPDALLELIAKLRTKAREIAESKRSVDLSWDALGQFDEGANLVSAVKTQTTEVTARLDAIQVALSNLASAAQKAHQLYTGADSDVAAGMQSITTNLDSIPAVLSQSAASTAAANELAGDVVTAAVTDHLVHPLQDAMPWLFGGPSA